MYTPIPWMRKNKFPVAVSCISPMSMSMAFPSFTTTNLNGSGVPVVLNEYTMLNNACNCFLCADLRQQSFPYAVLQQQSQYHRLANNFRYFYWPARFLMMHDLHTCSVYRIAAILLFINNYSYPWFTTVYYFQPLFGCYCYCKYFS